MKYLDFFCFLMRSKFYLGFRIFWVRYQNFIYLWMVIERVVSIEELMDTIYNLSQWFIFNGLYILVIFIVEVELE